VLRLLNADSFTNCIINPSVHHLCLWRAGLAILLRRHAALTGANGAAAGPRPAYADLSDYFVAQASLQQLS
jgi:hypothetical protein